MKICKAALALVLALALLCGTLLPGLLISALATDESLPAELSLSETVETAATDEAVLAEAAPAAEAPAEAEMLSSAEEPSDSVAETEDSLPAAPEMSDTLPEQTLEAQTDQPPETLDQSYSEAEQQEDPPAAAPVEDPPVAAPVAEQASDEVQALQEEENGIQIQSVGNASLAMVDKMDGKISAPEDFTLGSVKSAQFTICIFMNTTAKESFQFTIPDGFSAEMKPINDFTMTQETLENGDIRYTYASNNPSAEGTFDCLVTSDYNELIADVSADPSRRDFAFSTQIISEDQSSTVDAEGFTISLPTAATYTLGQVDTANNNFVWNPYQVGGTTVNVGVVHVNNQAASSRPGVMQKRLQIEVEKPAGSVLQTDWSLDIPLPLYLKTVPVTRTDLTSVEVCINGTWKKMTSYLNAFNAPNAPDAAQFNPVTGNPYGLPANMGDCTYTNELVLDLKDGLLTDMATDAGLGTAKTVYEWLVQASGIRLSFSSDVMWDPVYNGQTPESQLTSDALQSGSATFEADTAVVLTAGGAETASAAPLVMNVVNGTDKTLKVAIATIDKIPMDVTTTKTTSGSGGANAAANSTNDGYVAAFGTAKNTNYCYFTNLEASYDFPWEYSPTGTITLCPLSANGNYNNERNLTCYDYTVTISNTADNTTRVIPLPHYGYTNPATGKANTTGSAPSPINYTPDLAENEWVSNITVTAAKVWKQSYTADTSALTSATQNHPLFYANCTSKGTYIDGDHHINGDEVQVSCRITTDQTGTIQGETKTVVLVGPRDNIVLWGEDDSALRWPIGAYGESTPEFIELHLKKYSDTATYVDPYIEITGDAIALLNKVTHRSVVGDASTYLTLRGYRLNGGGWVDVDSGAAAALLDSSGDYYDLSSKIPNGRFLTGLRLAPLDLNGTTVDTVTTPSDTDRDDNTVKHYLEQTYYLYLYDRVWPSYLGYDDTLKQTYTNITDLDSSLNYDLSFHCDFLSGAHEGKQHLRDGISDSDLRSATLIYGDLPQKIYERDNNYYVANAPEGGNYRWKYYVTELANVAMDDGPALSSTDNYWGEMQNATLRFSGDTIDEQRMLALTKGVSLVGANWRGDLSMYLPEKEEHAVIRYQTNTHPAWRSIDTFKGTSYGDDRAVNLFPLSNGEYVTAIEVDYPVDFFYRSGYNGENTESNIQTVQLPDVGLLTNGTISKQSPIDGDNYYFSSGEQLPYHAELTFTDIGGGTHTLELDTKTAKLQPYPTMLVDGFTAAVSYVPSMAVYQGNVLTATVQHSYSFTLGTKTIDPDKVIHPTLCYQLDKNFTVADTAALAAALGISANKVTLSPKNDGQGDSILKIEFGELEPQTRDTVFSLVLPLTAKPNAQTINVTPIKNAWLTLDSDTLLAVEEEGEYVAINAESVDIENAPGLVLSDENWETGTRLALKQSLSQTININRLTSSSLVFSGTDGNGGGLGSTVTGRDTSGANVFGVTQTLYTPADPSTDWVVYVAIPSKGQEVPYGAGSNTAPASAFSLNPSGDVTVEGSEDCVAKYFIPSGTQLVPSMAGLQAEYGQTVDATDAAADAGSGVWKTWDEMSGDERSAATYVRITVDEMEANTEFSSRLLMQLGVAERKTTVGPISAYTALVYNYRKADGGWAFPAGTANNRDTGGKGSNYVKYILTDYQLSGQLWHEKDFNNTFVTAAGDELTSKYLSLALMDATGNTIYYNDNETPVTVEVDENGYFSAPVPSNGTYYLVLTSSNQNWLPVSYNSTSVRNGMRFVPGRDWQGNAAASNIATAEAIVTTNDVENINGGIEEWGQLTLDQEVFGTLADQKKDFSFTLKLASATIRRSYPAILTQDVGSAGETETSVMLTDGSNSGILLGCADAFTVRLPVGLEYTITEDNGAYTTNIISVENGVQAPHGDAASSVTAGKIASITYLLDAVNGDGGNVVHYQNRKNMAVVTGVNLGLAPLGALCASLAGLLLVFCRQKRKKRT